MSIRPQPYEPTIDATSAIELGAGRAPAVDGDRDARSKPSTRSRGSVAVGRVSAKTSGGGAAQGSSSAPHSMARPQRFSSIE